MNILALHRRDMFLPRSKSLCRDLTLSPGDIHVWAVFLRQPVSPVQELLQLLAPDEQNKAGTFYFERDRRRFIVRRATLRIILGHYLAVEPSRLQFTYSSQGKPALAESSSEYKLCFSLSHSEELALYAITRDRELGVDIERIRPVQGLSQIAEHFFSDIECAMFRRVPANQKEEAFFNCWTRKEAYIKAIGGGITVPLKQFGVTLAPDEPAKILKLGDDHQEADEWTLYDLRPAKGYVGALAVKAPRCHIECWKLIK